MLSGMVPDNSSLSSYCHTEADRAEHLGCEDEDELPDPGSDSVANLVLSSVLLLVPCFCQTSDNECSFIRNPSIAALRVSKSYIMHRSQEGQWTRPSEMSNSYLAVFATMSHFICSSQVLSARPVRSGLPGVLIVNRRHTLRDIEIFQEESSKSLYVVLSCREGHRNAMPCFVCVVPDMHLFCVK